MASSTQAPSKALKNLYDGSGLSETSPGSGVWVHGNNAFREHGIERGTMWSSGSVDGQMDQKPTVTFDLGQERLVGSFRVWNYNEAGWTGTGFKEVEISASSDGRQFTPLGSAIFEQASGETTTRGKVSRFGNPLALVISVSTAWATGKVTTAPDCRKCGSLPEGRGPRTGSLPESNPYLGPRQSRPIIPIRPAPVFPAPRTSSSQRTPGSLISRPLLTWPKAMGRPMTPRRSSALNDYPNAGAIIYLPNGTYVISKTLRWPHGRGGGSEEKNTVLQGQSRLGTVIRLKDNCPGYTDLLKPKAMVWTGDGPAQRFRNAIRNLTFDTGKGNPGAIGIRFNASNVGCLRDTTIRSGDGSGVIGLDQSYSDDFGPCFVKNLSVIGFDTGIAVAHGVNGIVYENITLQGQRKVGWENRGMPITIRNLDSHNSVTVLRNVEWYGLVTLIDARLTGEGRAVALPAIHCQAGGLFARNLTVSGYDCAIRKDGKPNSETMPGPRVQEWSQCQAAWLWRHLAECAREGNPGRALGRSQGLGGHYGFWSQNGWAVGRCRRPSKSHRLRQDHRVPPSRDRDSQKADCPPGQGSPAHWLRGLPPASGTGIWEPRASSLWVKATSPCWSSSDSPAGSGTITPG